MNNLPPRLLLLTLVVALLLKLVGVIVALGVGYYLVSDWIIERWWMPILTSSILLLWLLPWPRCFPRQHRRLAHTQLIVALILATLAPHIDLFQSSWVSPERLLQNSRFVNEINWSVHQMNNVHALGLLFVMVPVVLAAWQYGRWGMWLTLGWAGLLYFLTPFFLPPASFDWMLYAIAGFVQLGVTQILGLTVAALATAQRKEEAALKVANQKLAEQAAIIEQLATGRERTRLARELHDTLAHTLSATAVQLQAVSTLLKVSPETAVVELASAQQQIRHSLEEARRAITALRASPLEELGLAEALRQRLQTIGERAGLATQCHISPQLPPLPPLTEQTIYRIADEALLNAEKYAQASQLHLNLDHGRDGLVLTVQDNGTGFDVEQMSGNGRFGLIGMSERAALIGAILSVNSRPQQGTTVQMSLKMANGE